MSKQPDLDPSDPKVVQEIFRDPDKLEAYFETVAQELDAMEDMITESFEDSNGPQETFEGLNLHPEPLDFSRLTPPPTYEPTKIPKPKAQTKTEPEPKKEKPAPAPSPEPTPAPETDPTPSISILTQTPEPTQQPTVVQTETEPPAKKGVLLKGFGKKTKKKSAPKVEKKPTPKPKKKTLKETPKKLTTHEDLAKKLKEREDRIQDLLDPNRGGTSI